MQPDPAVSAFEQIAIALELSSETQGEMLNLSRILRERVEALEEELADLGRLHSKLTADVQAGFDRLDREVDAIDGRLTAVHAKALRALTDKAERNRTA